MIFHLNSSSPTKTPRLHKSSALICCLLFLGFSLSFTGCQQGDQRVKGGDCKSDDDCLGGWICDQKFCYRGERSAAELAAQKAALEEKKEKERKAKEDKKKKLKPGQGRLHARICPFFKNTDNSSGTIIAEHKESKEKHFIFLQRELSKDSMRDVFTFYSLPLGTYEVTAKYGVQVGGQHDTHDLNCDPKATHRPCEGETKRIVTVEAPKTSLDDELKEKRPCDWIAE